MAKFERKPAVLEAWMTGGNRNVQTADGFKKAQPGQWIVDLGNGLCELLSDEDFREKYSPKGKDAEAALKAEFKTSDQKAEEARVAAENEISEAVGNEAAEEKPAAKKKAKKKSKSKATKKPAAKEDGGDGDGGGSE